MFALNYLKERYLGGCQGKLNVLKFLKYFCVTVRRFAYFSSFHSTQVRINNEIFRNIIHYAPVDRTEHVSLSKRLTRRILNKQDESNLKKLLTINLLRGGVHPNPGPPHINLAFLTYNCRGLKDENKFKRLMLKVNNLIDKHYIVALQETHKIDEGLIERLCKHSFLKNCDLENKAGVMLFFDSQYKVKEIRQDKNSRYIIVALESNEINLIVANAYFPNDNKEAINFGEELYSEIVECQNTFPDYYIAAMGDYNTCFSQKDYLNRVRTKGEAERAKFLEANNEICEIKDAYRLFHPEGGFTWNRGNCFSRLDYIFVSTYLISKVRNSTLDWCMEKSDHAAVSCCLCLDTIQEKGPGIIRLNAKLLEDNKSKLEIRSQLSILITQIMPHWNPHLKLEFVKVGIRSAFANVASNRNKDKKVEIEELETQINRLKQYKEENASSSDFNENSSRTIKIEEAINELSNQIEIAKSKFSHDLAFKAGVKWYEEGEKSNKYFL